MYLYLSLGWKGGDQGGRPKSILFVEELTGLISENLPDLWKLGQTYLNKTLFQVIFSLLTVFTCQHPGNIITSLLTQVYHLPDRRICIVLSSLKLL